MDEWDEALAQKKGSSGCLWWCDSPGMMCISSAIFFGVILGAGGLIRECQQSFEEHERTLATAEEEGADTAEPQPERKPHDPAAEAAAAIDAAIEAEATALREKILRLPEVQRINWEREWGLGWNGRETPSAKADRKNRPGWHTSGDIGKYKGKTGGDVLYAFGKPDSAIQHGGVSGGAWTYIGLKADGPNPTVDIRQGSVTFILNSGVVTDVRSP